MEFTKLKILFAALFFANGVNAQSFLFSKRAGGTNIDQANAVANDISGNSYVVGYFREAATFESTPLVSYGTNTNDIFIAKYDINGGLIWVKSAGGNLDDNGQGVCVDPWGNCYVTGYFNGTAYFDADSLTGGGCFLAKYKPNGDLIWVQRAGNQNAVLGWGLSSDNFGKIYITGQFANTPTFGIHTIVSNGSYDMFVAKCDSSGNWLWAASYGDNFVDNSYRICADNEGNAYISGSLMHTSPSQNAFLGKYNPVLASWEWVIEGSVLSEAYDLALDSRKNIFLTGYFRTSNFTIGSVTINNTGQNNTDEIFIVKFDSLGNSISGKSYGGVGNDIGFAVQANQFDNVFLSGFFETDLTIGNDIINPTLEGTFFSKFNNNVEPVWTVQVAADNAYPMDIDIDINDNPIVVGYFGGSCTVGNNHFNSYGVYNDIFICKLFDQCSLIDDTSVTELGSSLQANAINVTYQWLDCDNNFEPVNGATQQTFNPASSTGTYAVIISDGACSDTSNCHIVLGVGITDASTSLSMTAYPNPATNEITVNGYNPAYLKLCNSVGQTVAEANKSNKLYGGNLPQGLYVLQLFDEKGGLVKTEKVVKE